jgi:membrane-bound lytic murein transglycosylase D
LFSAVYISSVSAFAQLEMVKSPQDSTPPLITEEQIIKRDPKQSFRNFFAENTTAKNKSYNNIDLQQLNPQAMSFVRDYIKKHSAGLYSMQKWAAPYFDMMDDILTQNGIPKQLKYLAVIESNLKANAVSWAGAVGPWQFMPETARGMGLRVDSYADDRTDYLKSTRAVSKYLNYLYDIYKDWLLVVAAYNCGPGRVNSAIAKARSNDFWNLQYYLPTETRNHVKKFIATHYVMEARGGVTTITREQALAMMPIVRDSATHQNVKVQTISGRYNSNVMVKYLNMSLPEFTKLNPEMDKILSGNNSYELRLPTEKAELFLNKKNEILNDSILTILNLGV